jgi:hypothetical protein
MIFSINSSSSVQKWQGVLDKQLQKKICSLCKGRMGAKCGAEKGEKEGDEDTQ